MGAAKLLFNTSLHPESMHLSVFIDQDQRLVGDTRHGWGWMPLLSKFKTLKEQQFTLVCRGLGQSGLINEGILNAALVQS